MPKEEEEEEEERRSIMAPILCSGSMQILLRCMGVLLAASAFGSVCNLAFAGDGIVDAFPAVVNPDAREMNLCSMLCQLGG
jgi:hypothetical protein